MPPALASTDPNNSPTPAKEMDPEHKGSTVYEDLSVHSDYFSQHQKKTIKHASVPIPSLLRKLAQSPQDMVACWESLPVENPEVKAQLLKSYVDGTSKVGGFKDWFFLLSQGYNLLFHGYGSKYELLKQFCRKTLDSFTMECKGFDPSSSVKNVLSLLCSKLDLPIPHTQAKCIDSIQDIAHALPRKFPKGVYLMLHNIESPSIRKNDGIGLLSLLAEVPGVKLIASLDHAMGPMLFDQTQNLRFKWVWKDVPTFVDYDTEIALWGQQSMKGGQGSKLAQGIKFIMASLTKNHKEVLAYLGNKQRAQTGTKVGDNFGMEFAALFRECKVNMIISQESQFRGIVSELTDHHLMEQIAIRGTSWLHIPFSNDIIESEILKAAP